jgi:hypothetical protein
MSKVIQESLVKDAPFLFFSSWPHIQLQYIAHNYIGLYIYIYMYTYSRFNRSKQCTTVLPPLQIYLKAIFRLFLLKGAFNLTASSVGDNVSICVRWPWNAF